MASSTTKREQYYLRPPSGDRRGYAIIKRKRSATGESSRNETVKTQAIRAINKQLASGALKPDEAREAAERELARLRHIACPEVISLLPANLRLLDKYWETMYSHREIIDGNSAYNRLRRAIEALGDTPLTASRDILQGAVNRALKGNRQRDAVSAINQILKWMGRPDAALHRFRKEIRKPRYLTLEEWQTASSYLIDSEVKLLAWIAITTGCRTGEIFSITDRSIRSNLLFIDEQLDRKHTPRSTKNRRARDIPVIPGGEEYIYRWLSLPLDIREGLRNKRFAALIRSACKKAFPKEQKKWLNFHDLRHSYAIHLLSRGVPIDLVAQALGDSVAVVQEHYVGFSLSKPGAETVRRLLR